MVLIDPRYEGNSFSFRVEMKTPNGQIINAKGEMALASSNEAELKLTSQKSPR